MIIDKLQPFIVDPRPPPLSHQLVCLKVVILESQKLTYESNNVITKLLNCMTFLLRMKD